MEITIAPPKPEKVESKSFIVKALMHTSARHGTFYLSGANNDKLTEKRSEANRMTRAQGHELLSMWGERHGISKTRGILLTVVHAVTTRGESGGRD